MTIKNLKAPSTVQKPILAYVKDLPNLCSLAGLGCTLLAIYFLLIEMFIRSILQTRMS